MTDPAVLNAILREFGGAFAGLVFGLAIWIGCARVLYKLDKRGRA